MTTTVRVNIKKDLGRAYHEFLKREAWLVKALDKRDKEGKGFDRESNWSETNTVGRVWSF